MTSLDKKVLNSRNKDLEWRFGSEESFSNSEVADIVSYARYLQERDNRREAILGGVGKGVASLDKANLQDVYGVAKDLDVPPEYVAKAMEIFHPSAETQRSDIEKYEAIPSQRLMADLLLKIPEIYGQTLLTRLQSFDPGIQIHSPRQFSWTRLFWDDDAVKRKISFRKKEMRKNMNLAKLEFELLEGCYNLTIEMYHPSFLRICGDSITDLSNKFEKYQNDLKLSHNYHPGF